MSAEGSVLTSLGLNTFSFLGQVVNFLILLFILKKFIYNPILNKLDERAKTIKKGIKAAEANVKKQEEMELEFDKKMTKASKEADKVIAQAKEDAVSVKEEIIASAKKDAQKMMEKKEIEIKELLSKQEKILEKKVVDVAAKMTKKVLQNALDLKVQEQIIESQLNQLKDIKLG